LVDSAVAISGSRRIVETGVVYGWSGLAILAALEGAKLVSVDMAYPISDRSWYSRQYGYELLWNAIRPGGVFISDDISRHMAFAEFVSEKGARFAETQSHNKFVGIALKPA